MNVVEDITTNPDSFCFDKATYADSKYPELTIKSINFYNGEKNLIVIYTRESKEFLKIFQPRHHELEGLMSQHHYQETHNFGGSDEFL